MIQFLGNPLVHLQDKPLVQDQPSDEVKQAYCVLFAAHAHCSPLSASTFPNNMFQSSEIDFLGLGARDVLHVLPGRLRNKL
eukprot:5880779-Amphidinium_carterae.1